MNFLKLQALKCQVIKVMLQGFVITRAAVLVKHTRVKRAGAQRWERILKIGITARLKKSRTAHFFLNFFRINGTLVFCGYRHSRILLRNSI